MKLIDDVLSGDRGLVMVASKDPELDEPGPEQVEIPTGSFRRAVELGVDIDAEAARATFEDGLLRIELPIRLPEATSRRVPIERSSD